MWQTQYELTNERVPQSVQMLLEALECAENAFPTEQEQPTKKSKTNLSNSINCKIATFTDSIPKKNGSIELL
jgi:hypothetical protein